MTHHSINFNGRSYPAELLKVKRNESEDLALYFIRGTEFHPSYDIAESDPPIGTPAKMVGYPVHLNTWRETIGKVETTKRSGPGWTSKIDGYDYQFNQMPYGGESGAPILVFGNKVGGVVSHRSGGNALVTSVTNIRKFLVANVGGVPKCRAPAPPKEDTPDPPGDDPPKPKPPAPFDPTSLLSRIKALEAKLEALENRKQAPLTLDLLFYNSKLVLVAKGTLKNGVIEVTLPDYIIELTKADGKTPVAKEKFPFGTPIRLKSEIPIEELRKALESK